MSVIWLRCEHRNDELRTPLTPSEAKKLIASGYKVVVEESDKRSFPIIEYRNAGCEITKENSWHDAPSESIILGIKGFPNTIIPVHRHLYFGHLYNNQPESSTTLHNYKLGGGILYDYESLIDDNGNRAVTFGFYAGIASTLLALFEWQKKHNSSTFNLYSSPTKEIKDFFSLIERLYRPLSKLPSIAVVGANGRTGKGVCYALNNLGFSYKPFLRKDTFDNASLNELFKPYNLIINCVNTKYITKPFLTINDLIADNNIEIIVDITCEPYSKNNPLPLYNKCTNIYDPYHIVNGVKIIAIDNVACILPHESSKAFSISLFPILCDLLEGKNSSVLHKALNTFQKKLDFL